jgi:hypothetical protein
MLICGDVEHRPGHKNLFHGSFLCSFAGYSQITTQGKIFQEKCYSNRDTSLFLQHKLVKYNTPTGNETRGHSNASIQSAILPSRQ